MDVVSETLDSADGMGTASEEAVGVKSGAITFRDGGSGKGTESVIEDGDNTKEGATVEVSSVTIGELLVSIARNFGGGGE